MTEASDLFAAVSFARVRLPPQEDLNEALRQAQAMTGQR